MARSGRSLGCTQTGKKQSLKSQYIEPYWKTCTHYWERLTHFTLFFISLGIQILRCDPTWIVPIYEILRSCKYFCVPKNRRTQTAAVLPLSTVWKLPKECTHSHRRRFVFLPRLAWDFNAFRTGCTVLRMVQVSYCLKSQYYFTYWICVCNYW